MSSFAILNDEEKIKKQRAKRARAQEKEAERQAQQQEKQAAADEEVKGRCWADVSDDDEQDEPAQTTQVPDSSDSESEEDVEGDCCSPTGQAEGDDTEAKPSAKKAVAPRQLTKKELAAKKAEELDDLDAVLAEFGIAEPTQAPVEPKKKKNKKDKKEEPAGTTECPEPKKEPPKEAPKEVDEAARQAALEALKKKQTGGTKKKGTDAKFVAQAEAKKRVANGPKAKKDKLSYDR